MKQKIMDVMQRGRRAWVWLCRMSKSRGFGVQSPWAYGFIRYVVSEHYPYYAYEALDARFGACGYDERRLAKLYFRLANFVQADRWEVNFEASEMFREAVKRGCRRSVVLRLGEAEAKGCETAAEGSEVAVKGSEAAVKADGAAKTAARQRRVVLLRAERTEEVEIEALLGEMGAEDVLVVEAIGTSRGARELWQRIGRSELSGVSFDLYYCGIVFFDLSRYKQHYKVNF